MPNRAERRAQNKRASQGVPQQYDQTRGRARSGMLDEYALQERSRRLVENNGEQWAPNGGMRPERAEDRNPSYSNPKLVRAPHSARQIVRIASWVFIALSIVAFFVVMWLPTHPIWLIITVSACFAIGVLSLFVVAGDASHNPNLDAHGTAV